MPSSLPNTRYFSSYDIYDVNIIVSYLYFQILIISCLNSKLLNEVLWKKLIT